MPEISPSSRGRELGERLRILRNKAGLTSEVVAKQISVSESKISRLENGLRSPRVMDVENLLFLYGVDDETERARILDLAKDLTANGWRSQLKASWLSKEEQFLVGYENDATGFRCFADLIVPPLLQTGAYARALLTDSVTVPLDKIEQEVAGVLARQAILSRAQPPTLSVVLTELVLRTVVKSPADMAAQLYHLVNSTVDAPVELRVLPTVAGAHAGIDGRFTIMDFAGVGSVVHMSYGTSHGFTCDAGPLAMYERMHARLVEKSLDPDASIDFISKLASGFNRGR